MGNWQVKRQVGSGAPIFFKFPVKFILRAGGRVTVSHCCRMTVSIRIAVKDASHFLYLLSGWQIWASGSGGSHNPPTDLVWKTQPSWGTGDLLQTTLISASGEVFEMYLLNPTWTYFSISKMLMNALNVTVKHYNTLSYRKWRWGRLLARCLRKKRMTWWEKLCCVAFTMCIQTIKKCEWQNRPWSYFFFESVIASAGGPQHLWWQRVQLAQPDRGLRLLRTSVRQVHQLFCVLSLPLLPQRRHLRGFTAPLLRVQHQHSTQGGGHGNAYSWCTVFCVLSHSSFAQTYERLAEVICPF